jgi:isocitrate dehydrogenase kinase/phosphatase
MSGEIWYSVGPKDVFPETFGPFLLGNPARARGVHAAPCRPAGRGLLAKPPGAHPRGHVYDVFPYEQHKRFRPLPTDAQLAASIGIER